MQIRLAARLADAFGAGVPGGLSGTTGVGAPSLPPLPQNLAPLYAHAVPVDPAGWLARLPDGRTWLCRPVGAGTFGPREANGLDSVLLAEVAAARRDVAPTLILIGDSQGHEVSRRAESLCVSQYLAQHAAVLALLRAQGVVLRGLLSGVGHSAEFFSHVLQAQKIDALADARVVAMELAALARVTRLPQTDLAALVENDPLLGHPVRHFARWAGMAALLPDANPGRLFPPGV
jgi:biotin-independent malonate decarboxylase gamma subunit